MTWRCVEPPGSEISDLSPVRCLKTFEGKELVILTSKDHLANTVLPVFESLEPRLLLSAQMVLTMLQVEDPGGNMPAGYTAYDFVATTDTLLGAMELVLDTDAASGIYQDPAGGNIEPDPSFFASFPSLEFDTYVTMGDYSTPVFILGNAESILPGSQSVFDDQNLNICWGAPGGSAPGPGSFQIARVTLKDSANGSWTLMGWQSGGSDPVTITGTIVPTVLVGDVDNDGFVGDNDLSIVISNWGLSGATRTDGDLNGNGVVDGPDYSEVISYWGNSYVAPVPEFPPDHRPDPPSAPDWTQRYFVDDAVPPHTSAEDYARGFMLYSRSYLSLVYDNSVPHGDDTAEDLNATASIGESESMTIGLYALRDINSITLQLGNLTYGQEVINSAQIEIHVAENQYVRLHTRPNPEEYVYMPRYLYPQGDVNVDLYSAQSAWFWITVNVPENAAPGTYTGNLTISVGGQQEAVLPVEFEVLDIQLDDLSGYPTGYYARYTNPEPSWTVEDRINYMAAYGGSAINLLVSDDAFPNIWKDGQGQIHVDIAGSNYEAMMDAYTNAGFDARPQMTLSGRIYNRLKALGYTPNTSDYSPTSPYNAAYLEVLQQLKAYGDQRGWPVPFLCPLDEAPSHAAGNPELFDMIPIQLSLMKNAGFGTELNHFLAYGYTSWQNACLPYLDIMTMCYSTNGGPQSRPSWNLTVEYANYHGLKLQVYNTLWPGSVQPTSFRFMGGWFYRTWGDDVTGNYFYVFDERWTSPDNDLADFRGTVGDASFFAWRRPDPSQGLTGGPAIDTVALREGLDDLRYILTLERLIAEGSASANPAAQQAAADAAAVLQGLIDSFDFSNAPHLTEPIYGTAQAELMDQGTRDSLPMASGELLYRNGWDPADYDAARGVIAQQIITLQDLLVPPEVFATSYISTDTGDPSMAQATVAGEPSAGEEALGSAFDVQGFDITWAGAVQFQTGSRSIFAARRVTPATAAIDSHTIRLSTGPSWLGTILESDLGRQMGPMIAEPGNPQALSLQGYADYEIVTVSDADRGVLELLSEPHIASGGAYRPARDPGLYTLGVETSVPGGDLTWLPLLQSWNWFWVPATEEALVTIRR